MSFMAGFGDAFSRSFEAGNERNARRKEDFFKLMYSDFIDRRKEVEAYDDENKKAARKAEAFIENSGVDPRAYPHVFKQVKSGVDDSVILEDLRTGTFSFDDDTKESVTPVEGGDEPAGESEDPMVAQMAGSGMAEEPAAPAEVAPAPGVDPAASGQGGSFLGGLLPSFNGNRAERDKNRALSSVAGVAGISPEEVQATLSGSGMVEPEIDTSGIQFTPAAANGEFVTLAEAIFKRDQAKAAGNFAQAKHFDDMARSHNLANEMEEQAKTGGAMWIVRDDEGNVKHVMGQQTDNGIFDPMEQKVYEPIRQVDEDEKKLWSDLAVDSKTVTEFKKKQADLAGLYTLGDELSQMADLSPEALTTVGGVSTGLAALTREADALVNVIGELGASPEQMSELKKYEDSITQALLSPGMKNAAEVRTLIEAKLKLASYRFSSTEGEDGRSRSNLDIARFDQILRASRDPKVFKQSLASYLADIEGQVDTEGRALNQYNPIITNLETQYGYSPVGAIVPSFGEFWKATSDQPAYENIKKFHSESNILGQPGATPPATDGAPAAQPQAPLAVPNEKHIQALRSNEALASEFDKKFGVGAAAKILQGQ